MERPMDNWNDDRLDELSRRMDDGFTEMRESFKAIRSEMVTRQEMKELIASINLRFDAVDKRFDAVDKRFDAVDHRFDMVDSRFNEADGRFARLEDRVDRLYYACVTLLVLLIASSIANTVLG